MLAEQPRYANMQIPENISEQKMLLRSLMNIRMPGKIDPKFLKIQDVYLSEENEKRGIVTLADMKEVQPDFYIWKGDITRLKVGAIVNAANSGMTGCYQSCHSETYDNEELIKKMVVSQGFEIRDGDLMKPEGIPLKTVIPTELIPKCPKCGRPMSMNLRAAEHKPV